MANTNINIRMDADLKRSMEEACSELGMTMTTAFTIFAKKVSREKERRLQEAMLDIKKRYGKNAVLKGTNLIEGATAIDRNTQIGGHKA